VAYDVPSGVESYSCGSTDLGNGYFQDQICTRTTYRTEYRTETYQAPVYRQEPVYDHLAHLGGGPWEVVRTPVAQGGDTMPEWPVVDLHNREREGARTENWWPCWRTRTAGRA
jgi:hypothetical protein